MCLKEQKCIITIEISTIYYHRLPIILAVSKSKSLKKYASMQHVSSVKHSKTFSKRYLIVIGISLLLLLSFHNITYLTIEMHIFEWNEHKNCFC